jgi:hypothetical protein
MNEDDLLSILGTLARIEAELRIIRELLERAKQGQWCEPSETRR